MTRHRLLRASAGTGKTYQLVEAYVAAVLEDGLRPGEVVAITFTRKAAQELKQRIRARLRKAGVAPMVLTELGRAPISNFHGLALQQLKAFGFEAGFSDATQVLGESGDDAQLFWEACEDAWFGADPACAEAVQTLAPFVSVDYELPWALWDAINRAREDDQPIGAALLGQYDPVATQARVHEALTGLRAQLAAARGQVTGKGVEKLAAFLEAPLPDPAAEPSAFAQAWRLAFGCLDRRGTLGKVFSEADKSAVAQGLEHVLAEAQCHALAPALSVLLERGWQAYTRTKSLLRALDFADIIERFVAVLSHREDLHAAVRRRYKAVLVDEAQDTNRLQRRLVNLLAGFDGPAKGTTPHASLFVVGDWKQSIYTFRGADPRSFALFARDLQERGGTETTLSVSRRSQARLVAGINDLGVSLFGDDYEPLEPLDGAPEDAAAGMTWFELPPDEDGKPAGPIAEARAVAQLVRERVDAGQGAGDFAVLLATMTQAPLFLQALAQQGVPAVLGGGGGLYAQPEILDAVALLAWLADGRERLQGAIALRSPLVGVSDAALLALLTPREGEGDPLWRLRRGDLPANARLTDGDRAALEAFARVLPDLVAAAPYQRASSFFEQLDAACDLRATYLALDHGEQRLANLNRLAAMAERADATAASVPQFARAQLERIRLGHAEPITPVPAAARRAVTISSVHQSKGLQYPVVLLAGLGRKGRQDTAALRYAREHGLVFRPKVEGEPKKSARWHAAHAEDQEVQEGEQKRLLYVAVTRAEREVLFVAPSPDALGRDGFARLLAPWAQTAPRDLLRTEPAPTPAPPAPTARPTPSPEAWESTDRAVAQALSRRAAPGTHFEITVTQLAGAAAEETSRRVTPRRPLADDATADMDPPLDPFTRGRLAHAVLANLERRAAHSRDDDFVAAELRTLGYEPDDSRLTDVRADVAAFLASPLGLILKVVPPGNRRHELPFQLTTAAAPYRATLRGQLDLLYWDAEGPVIVDYKHARASSTLDPYFLQLDAYAWAVRELCQVQGPIRTRLVFLRDRDRSPYEHLVTPARIDAVATRLTRLVRTIAQTPALNTNA